MLLLLLLTQISAWCWRQCVAVTPGFTNALSTTRLRWTPLPWQPHTYRWPAPPQLTVTSPMTSDSDRADVIKVSCILCCSSSSSISSSCCCCCRRRCCCYNTHDNDNPVTATVFFLCNHSILFSLFRKTRHQKSKKCCMLNSKSSYNQLCFSVYFRTMHIVQRALLLPP